MEENRIKDVAGHWIYIAHAMNITVRKNHLSGVGKRKENGAACQPILIEQSARVLVEDNDAE